MCEKTISITMLYPGPLYLYFTFKPPRSDYCECFVQYLDPGCSVVEVKVLEIGNTQVKYKCLKVLFK